MLLYSNSNDLAVWVTFLVYFDHPVKNLTVLQIGKFGKFYHIVKSTLPIKKIN